FRVVPAQRRREVQLLEIHVSSCVEPASEPLEVAAIQAVSAQAGSHRLCVREHRPGKGRRQRGGVAGHAVRIPGTAGRIRSYPHRAGGMASGRTGDVASGSGGGVASRRGWLQEGSGATALSEEGASCLRHLVDICDIWVHVGARGHDVVMRALDRVVIRAVDRCVIGVLSTENPDNATVERKEQGSGEAKERGNENVRERRAGETREQGESGGPLSSVALRLVASIGARTATSATSTSVALVASTSASVASASTSVPLATSA